MQILGSNYGLRYNQAPVVEDAEAITHEDLSVEIPLADLARDPEGDRTNVLNNSAIHDSRWVSFLYPTYRSGDRA